MKTTNEIYSEIFDAGLTDGLTVEDAHDRAKDYAELVALRAERDELRAVVDEVSKMKPATRVFNPGIGAGKLNGLIYSARAALNIPLDMTDADQRKFDQLAGKGAE